MAKRSSAHGPGEEIDWGQFRYAAAALVKYLIRAREKADPGFLAAEDYQRWGLADIAEDSLSIPVLLQLTFQTLKEIDEKYLKMGGSVGLIVDNPDPVWVSKCLVGCLIDYNYTLRNAIQAARDQNPIDWEHLAAWDTLAELRDALDKLPHPAPQSSLEPASESESQIPTDYIRLDSAAAWVGQSKRTLERCKQREKDMPKPAIKGGGGKASEWLWDDLRPWLEKRFGRKLPKRLPSIRLPEKDR